MPPRPPTSVTARIAPARSRPGHRRDRSEFVTRRPRRRNASAQNAIESVRALFDQGLRIMKKRVEVLERHIAFIAGLFECVHHRRPVRGSVEQRPKRIERMIRSFLGEFLEMNVLDPAAQ